MDAGLSFQPGQTQGGTPSSALTPLQSAVQVLSLNLPTAAARATFSPLAAGAPNAHGFNPEALVAQTLLKSLGGTGVPHPALMAHLTSLLTSVGQSAPTTTPTPTVSLAGNGAQTAAPTLGTAVQAPRASVPVGGMAGAGAPAPGAVAGLSA